MEKYRFLLSGSGGQGVITMSILLAEAAALFQDRQAVQSQVYGPQARGGATRADVIISDSPIFYPKVRQPNILVALTDEAAAKYLPLIRPGGLCLYDSDLLTPGARVDARRVGLPMRAKVVEALGREVAFNICVLGALAVLTRAVSLEALERLLEKRFEARFHEANRTALRLGADMAAPFAD